MYCFPLRQEGTAAVAALSGGTLAACVQGGKVMFASTLLGAVRSYRVPLNGDFNEIRSHGAAVTGMRLFYDNSLLFTVSNDGALFVFDVRAESKSARRDLERLPFAEEVMVTKSDLEERRSRCAAFAAWEGGHSCRL